MSADSPILFDTIANGNIIAFLTSSFDEGQNETITLGEWSHADQMGTFNISASGQFPIEPDLGSKATVANLTSWLNIMFNYTEQFPPGRQLHGRRTSYTKYRDQS